MNGEHKQPTNNHLYDKSKEGTWRVDVGIEDVSNVGGLRAIKKI